MSWTVCKKTGFPVPGHTDGSGSDIQTMTLCTVSFELIILLQPNFDGKSSQASVLIVKILDCCCVQSHSESSKFQLICVQLESISLMTKPFVVKLGVVMQHHKLVCHVKKLVC